MAYGLAVSFTEAFAIPSLPSVKLTLAGWNIPMFNRIHTSSISGPFSSATLVYRSVKTWLSMKPCEKWYILPASIG